MNFNEKKSFIISLTICLSAVIIFFINDISIFDGPHIQKVTFVFYLMSFMGMFILVNLSNYAVYKEKKVTRDLLNLQKFDSLTGCPNWIKFQMDCKSLLRNKKENSYAMVVFDIDKFKAINDLFSYAAGNEILMTIGHILETYIREDELFSRTAADNFNILMINNGYSEFSNRLESFIKKINTCSDKFVVNISLGIYLIEDENLDISVLSDRAIIAKRSIKDNFQVKYAFYRESMRHVMICENDIENRMEAALYNEEFEVYLQPKYLFSDEKIIGAEALVRWNDSKQGLLSPNEFIPLFEKNGFVKKIDKFVFKEVCKLLNKWKNETNQFNHMIISVNFSRLHLDDLTLPEELWKITKHYQIDPKMIEIELTEGTIFDNDLQMPAVMNRLKDFGFQISIDDFGKAYSSLNTLKSLPANILKLDKGFFSKSPDDERGKKIIASILNMAKDLDLITVAEGVETRDQVDFLKEIGCDIAQGFYYSKPMPIMDFETLVMRY